MAGDAPDRFAPLLEIRRVAQRAETGQVAEAVAVSERRDRELAAARRAVEAAQRRLAAAEASLAALAAAGTTAALAVVATEYGRRCRARLREAQAELDRAAGAAGASEQALQVARDRLVTARSSRELLERYLERSRQQQRQLRERRDD